MLALLCREPFGRTYTKADMPRVRASGNDMVLVMSVNEGRTSEAPDQPMAESDPKR